MPRPGPGRRPPRLGRARHRSRRECAFACTRRDHPPLLAKRAPRPAAGTGTWGAEQLQRRAGTTACAIAERHRGRAPVPPRLGEVKAKRQRRQPDTVQGINVIAGGTGTDRDRRRRPAADRLRPAAPSPAFDSEPERQDRPAGQRSGQRRERTGPRRCCGTRPRRHRCGLVHDRPRVQAAGGVDGSTTWREPLPRAGPRHRRHELAGGADRKCFGGWRLVAPGRRGSVPAHRGRDVIRGTRASTTTRKGRQRPHLQPRGPRHGRAGCRLGTARSGAMQDSASAAGKDRLQGGKGPRPPQGRAGKDLLVGQGGADRDRRRQGQRPLRTRDRQGPRLGCE